MQKFEVVNTLEAPQPAGTYSQAVLAQGPFLFISGQVPRLPNGKLLASASIEDQTKRVLENIQQIALSAGMELKDSVHLTVYLNDLAFKHEFENVYKTFFTGLLPARVVVQSSFKDFDVEISAILQKN